MSRIQRDPDLYTPTPSVTGERIRDVDDDELQLEIARNEPSAPDRDLDVRWLTARAANEPGFRARAEGVAKTCSPLQVSTGELSASVWNRECALALKVAGGKPAELTFSMDSELPSADLVKYASQRPELLAELEAQHEPQPVAKLCKMFSLSDKQLRKMALRKGVPKDAEAYRVTDLNGVALGRRAWALDAFHSAGPIEQSLLAEGLPVRGLVDQSLVEVVHETCESSPAAFATLVRELHDDFAHAQTHLHVGLPSRAVSIDQAKAIARALEAIVTLELAAAWYEPDGMLMFNSSELAGRPGRGPVYLKPEAFGKPETAHDLELRQYGALANSPSIERGLELLELGARLAISRDRLRIDRAPLGRTNLYVGNLSGALEYAAQVLSKSSVAKHRRWAKALEPLAYKVYQCGEDDIPVELRKTVYDFLIEHDVIEALEQPGLHLEKLGTP